MTRNRKRTVRDAAVKSEPAVVAGTVDHALKVGRNRLALAGALFAVAFMVVGLRLVGVTLFNDGFEPRLAVAAPTKHAQFGRRDIVDRNGMLLATSLPTASLYADPGRVLDADEAATKLAAALPDVSRDELLSKLTSARRFVWIKRNLTPRQQMAVIRLGLPGIAFQHGERRVYPLGPLLSHVVGYTDIDSNGLAGVEMSFDDGLRSSSQGGGEPLQLSIDARFQYVVRDVLTKGMATFGALGAAGIVLDAANGEVLAMVSLPDFDPNRLDDGDSEARFNRASLGAYEMGSTFKLFTLAMALDSGAVTMQGGYDVSKPIHVARFVIRDYKPEKGRLSVPDIFIKSSNIGAAKIALDVGAEKQRDYLSRLGLLRPADIELPEIATPMLPAQWREVNTMTIAYGHGVAVSPLQLTAAAAATINGGLFHPPTIVKRPADEPTLGWRVISERTSRQLRALMHLVVARGTGKKAAVPGYLVGGKTGSAEKPGVSGYRRRALLSSFVAAFPINAPRYVVFVMYDEPHGTKDTFNYATGGWTAAPAVGRIIARIGPIAGIAPLSGEADAKDRRMLVALAGKEEQGVAF